MATVRHGKKACTVNPLKMSQPVGGALAFMGLASTMPILHGSQGCTAFGMVLFVRHFKESIPLQTTAMSEVATVLGGLDNIEQAVMNIYTKSRPEIIGMCSTGLTETKGDDVEGYLTLTRKRHPELADTSLIYVSTPDFKGAFQDGWAATVKRILEVLVEPAAPVKEPRKVAVLPGCHLTVADIEELRETLEDFGLDPVFVPDLSGSLDGHVPEDFSPTTIGGTTRADIRALGSAGLVLALGEQMRPAAEWLGSTYRCAGAGVRPAAGARGQRRLHGLACRVQRPAGPAQVPPPAQPVGRRHAGWALLHRRQPARDRRRTRSAAQRGPFSERARF